MAAVSIEAVTVMTRAVVGQYINQIRVYLRDKTDRAVPARELAEHLQLLGNHETRRRRIRRLIGKMHEHGMMICADCHPTQGGYWLARCDAEWQRYLAARASQARFRFIAIRAMRDAAVDDNNGQRRLF